MINDNNKKNVEKNYKKRKNLDNFKKLINFL